MLVVHWTPVKNTKHILKNGLGKSQKGVFCFPLTGNKIIDKFWVNLFNNSSNKNRQRYNGIVCRLTQNDLPAYFGHWIGATNRDEFNKPITDIKTLEKQIRQMIYWRIGNYICHIQSHNLMLEQMQSVDFMVNFGEMVVKNNPSLWHEVVSDSGFLGYIFEDLQIVISQPISAKRIVKIIPQNHEFGRTTRQNKLIHLAKNYH